MKHLIILVLFLSSGILMAQNQKTTVPRKVILENFTTGPCGNCPPIHVLLENYVSANPNAIIIAQHAGYYTDVMTIPENTELLALYNDGGSTYAPGLAIDRYHYPTPLVGGTPDPGPVFWPGESPSATTARIDDKLAIPSKISLEISHVNNGGVLDLDIQGEILETVTGDDLRLLVYIIEDGIIANQSGGGSNYEHNNVMRDAISGTWGDAGIITSNTGGTTFSEQYSYTPDPSWVMNKMSIVAFVANYDSDVNNREILQADKISLAEPSGTNNVSFVEVQEILDPCFGAIQPAVKINNLGADDVVSFSGDYTINAGASTGTFSWTGTPIGFNQTANITLDEIFFAIEASNTIEFNITQVNGVVDDDPSNNSGTSSFDEAPEPVSQMVHLELHTDNYGSECTWNIKDSNGTIIESGGPYGNGQTINESFTMPGAECYSFNIIDSYGDGGGAVYLRDDDNNMIYSTNGAYGSGETQSFKTAGAGAGVDDNAFSTSLIFPNPANANLTIKNATGLNVVVYDVLGRELIVKESISETEQINVSNLAEGTYIVQLTNGVKTRTEKIVIAR